MTKFALGIITGMGAATIAGILTGQWIQRQFQHAMGR